MWFRSKTPSQIKRRNKKLEGFKNTENYRTTYRYLTLTIDLEDMRKPLKMKTLIIWDQMNQVLIVNILNILLKEMKKRIARIRVGFIMMVDFLKALLLMRGKLLY